MNIYVAWIQENDWETTPWNIGCYSTTEKAKNAILKELRNIESKDILSLEVYENIPEEERNYCYGIEKHKLDE